MIPKYFLNSQEKNDGVAYPQAAAISAIDSVLSASSCSAYFNRSEIMKAAWRNYRRFNVSFAEALRMAWYEAKKAAARYNVYGKRIHDGAAVLLLANATDNAAQECKYMNRYRFDVIQIKAA